jgi:hypothetical protein
VIVRYFPILVASAASFVLLTQAETRAQTTPTPTPTPPADLSLKIALDTNPPAFGSTAVFTFAVTNNGPGVASSARVVGSLPSTLPIQSISTDPDTTYGGSWGSDRFDYTVGFAGNSWAKGNVRHIYVTVKVQTRFAATVSASVSASSQDTNQHNNSASYTTSAPPPATAKLLNISTRARVLTGDNVLIGGFILRPDNNNNGSMNVILRGIGPSLAAAGVQSALSDPVLELHRSGGGLVAVNDSWRTDSGANDMQSFGLAPTDDREAAMKQNLYGGVGNQQGYTAVVSGKGGGTGIALVEAYDLDRFSLVALANISTRAMVGVDQVLIGGFILGGGNDAGALLIRGLGPSVNVPDTVANPVLDLYDGQGALLAENDNWKDSQEADIRSTTLAPSNDSESAIFRTLPSGNYTAIVRGKNSTTGIGLVEVYSLQ